VKKHDRRNKDQSPRETVREPLRNVLVAITDTKLFLGYHYGEWTFGPPTLEAGIACCSMSQDEFGHSRLLNGILSQHFGDDPESLLRDRLPGVFGQASFLDHRPPKWSDLIAMNLVVDVGCTLCLASFRNSSFQPLALILDKLLEEEKYHLRHAEGWLRAIAAHGEESRLALQKAIERALESWSEWLGPDAAEDDAALLKGDVKRRSNAEVFRQYVEWLVPLQNAAGMVDPSPSRWIRKREGTSWEGWRSENRRRSASTPDENILQQLRGSKNEVFKLVK
jgi:phenylacetate-CoA oxygenase PaaI subunit